jgi:MoaA/NifB/PqqE/SkfB family radical SAM enzyme
VINKNRKRKNYTFANINLLGKCNVDCYFCLGKDIEKELRGKNQLNTHFSEWKNFDLFLKKCEQNNIKKLYLTGQTADGLQYKYLKDIICYLQEDRNFKAGVRTNGYLALKKMKEIKMMDEEIGFSIHSLNPKTNKKIMGTGLILDWKRIIPFCGDNVRVSIVLNRYNVNEFFDLLEYISQFGNVRYIQVRRISTDTRYEFLKEDIELYEKIYKKVKEKYKQTGEFYLAQKFEIFGKEVNFWRTVETNINSLNYFTDGTVSDEYFIVEGYLKNKVKT